MISCERRRKSFAIEFGLCNLMDSGKCGHSFSALICLLQLGVQLFAFFCAFVSVAKIDVDNLVSFVRHTLPVSLSPSLNF